MRRHSREIKIKNTELFSLLTHCSIVEIFWNVLRIASLKLADCLCSNSHRILEFSCKLYMLLKLCIDVSALNNIFYENYAESI